jgi:Asp/Glu/hydantoin racemase
MESQSPRRLLVINPNTTAAITETVMREVSLMLGGEAVLVPATGRFGARYVASRAAAAIAAHAALDAYAQHGKGCDAVLLACFGDPGLDALRELAGVPVVGLADAACHLACQLATRFAIVTGGDRWGPMLGEFVAARGLAARLASIRTVVPTGAEIVSNPVGALEQLIETVQTCVKEDAADCVILGGAGLVGLARRIQPHVPVPVLCSVAAGAAMVLSLLRLPRMKPVSGSYASTPPVESLELSSPLTALLAGQAAEE